MKDTKRIVKLILIIIFLISLQQHFWAEYNQQSIDHTGEHDGTSS